MDVSMITDVEVRVSESLQSKTTSIARGFYLHLSTAERVTFVSYNLHAFYLGDPDRQTDRDLHSPFSSNPCSLFNIGDNRQYQKP